MTSKKSYYVVFKGKTPGIYDSVITFKEQVDNFKGAEFRKFGSFKDASEAYQSSIKLKMAAESLIIPEKSKKIALNQHWESYITCILLHMIWPTLPILIELMLTGNVSVGSLTLTVSIYAISIGMSSKSKSQFTLSILISFIFACCYGFTVHNSNPISNNFTVRNTDNISFINLKLWSIIAIGLIFMTHLVERYNRHILDRVPFFNF